MKMIRVMHVLPGLSKGGAARTVQTFVAYRNKKNFELSILCYGDDLDRADFFKKQSVSVYHAKEEGEILHALNTFKPDVLHFHFSGEANPTILFLAKEAKKRKIYLVGTNIFSYYSQELDSLIHVQLFQSLMMLSIKFARKSQLSELPHKKYRVMYNPVDTQLLNKYALTKQEREKYRSKLNIPPSSPVIGRVGRADVVKWGDLLLESLPSLWESHPDCHVVIRGLPSSRKKWVDSLDKNNQIHLLPETTDDHEIMSTYQIMDVYAHSVKIGEACGNAINEAMYWKLPVVTQSTPWCDNGQLEQVDHGVTGYIANSPENFAAAISHLLNNKKIANTMGEKGRAKIAKNFSPETTTQQLEYLYKELLGKQVPTQWFPSAQSLLKYPSKYESLLKKEFVSEKETPYWKSLLRLPRRFFFRVIDILIVQKLITL